MWGGNAALLGLVDDPESFMEECPHALPETGRVRAVIALAGVFDYSEEGDFFAGFIDRIGDFMGGTPDQAPENWAMASAITWVKGNEPPFLLVHGEADTNVAPHQSEKLAAALEGAGADVELVLLPGVDHYSSVSDPRVFQAMQSFLEQLEQTTAIDTYLRSLEEEGAFSGAVLVAREGQVLLSKGYGLANREEGIPNTPQTRFRLCSITKQFTAMGILILQDQGALDVQDRLCDYVADCPLAWKDITLHQLLVHTSGIPDFADLPNYEATKGIPATPLEIIDRFRSLPLDFAPGQEWRYSNSGYILLGYIIEQVSGQPYDAFIQEHIFQPLGMADSGYDHNLDIVATGYTGEDGRWRKADYIDMSIPYAAGALYSTVEDMYRWDQALYTEQLVPQALLGRMFTSFADSPLGGYGYGWFITRQHNRPVVRHGGGGDGFITLIERYPDDRVTIIVLCNRENADLGTIVTRIGQEVFRR
jgi:CubicO group peptidase (beta-lactamase class C family)